MRSLKLFIALFLLVAPFVAHAQVDHAPKWSSNTSLTYNLIDLDNFAVGSYGYCKWGNLQDRLDVFLETDLDFTRLTALPYNNSNTDLFLAADSDISLQAYLFPSWTVWNSDNSLSIGSGYSIRLYRYLHFRNELVDAATGSPLTGNETKLIILFHGWNPDSNSDAYAGSEFATLVNNLKAVTNGTDWKVVKYRWEADSDTGSVIDAVLSPDALINNATEAAEISNQHGQHLGQLLTEQFVSLQKVHVIAHSAGSWAARGTLRYLLDKAPNVSCQMTLLDPFMPNSTEATINSSLGTAVMSQFDNTFSAKRSTRLGPLENYYAKDTLVTGTQEVFSWATTDINAWINRYDSYYTGHSGPISFYSDTIWYFHNNFPYKASLINTNLDLRPNPDTTPQQIGWNNSLFLNEPVFTSQPQSQSINETSTLTLTAPATTRKNLIISGSATNHLTWLWFKNNQYLTSTTTPSLVIQNVQASDSGKYHAAIYDAAYPANRTTTQYADVKVTALLSQTITFNSLANKTYGAAPFTLSATASSGLTPTFTIASGPATISGNTVTLTGAGTVVVRASQAGNASYLPATSVDQSFTVGKATAPVTLGSLSQSYTGTARSATATTTPAGLTVTFTYDGGATAPTNAGSYAVIGTINDSNYQGSASGTLVISKTAQTITFAAPPSKTYGAAPFTVSATASSGLAPTFSIVSGPATISGSTVTITGVGTVLVRAAQTGNTNYATASTVDQSFTVGKATAPVTLGSLSQSYTGTARSATATTTPAGLTVTFTYDDGATAPTNAGSYAVIGTINDSNYQGFASGTLVVAKASQAITFGTLSAKTYGDAPFTLSATASSGLTPVFIIVSGPATISSNTTVTLTGAGMVVVRAAQAGDSNYAAAPTVDQAFTVLPSFYSWRQDKALPVGKNGPNDDAAGYGIPNLMAYGLAFDPKVPPPTTSGVTPGTPAVSKNGTNVRMEFVKDSSRSDIEVTAEVSSDLVTWTTVPHQVVESSGSLQHCRAEQPLGTTSRQFMRVKIRQLTPAP